SVGASAERLRWALGVARAARARSGLDPASLVVGACVVAATAPRPEDARDLVRANVGIFARFNGQASAAGGSPADGDRTVERAVAERYDESRHGLAGAAQTGALPDEYVDRLAVVGAPARCAERLEELASVGLDHLLVVGPSRDVDAGLAVAAVRRFAGEVLPRLR
ncbi:MAG: LLM class flavin-dependent oxidoreductase, partial [Acidimicrobiales bacterium]